MMRRAARAGFTLLEVLIALGLSVLLISGVYAAIEMHYRYQSAGRAEIRGQQLLRGLIRTFSRDIGSTVLAVPLPMASTSTGQAADEVGVSSTSSSSTTSSVSSSSSSALDDPSATGTSPNFAGLTDAGLPGIFGVVGTEELLHLCVSLPTREQNYVEIATASTPEDRSGEMQIVTIGLTNIDSVSLSILQKNLKVTRPGVGLGRRVRDLFSSVASEATLEPQHLLAPEVTELSFRYFDSGEWFGSWDSLEMGRLPRAIEMNFGFWNPPVVQVGQTKRPDEGTMTYVQHVFNVPVSIPTIE